MATGVKGTSHSSSHAYYSSSAIVLKAKSNLEGDFKVDDAIKDLHQVYENAIQMIHAEYNLKQHQEGIPLCVTLQLIDLLSMDQIQYEDQLKYEIAKACRVFMDLTFIAAVQSHRDLYPATHKDVGEKLQKVMETLPSKEVRTEYELRCCWATSLVLVSARMYAKQFFINNISDIVSAIVNQSIGDLAGPAKTVLKDLYHLIDTRWFSTVFPLQLRSQALVARFPSFILNDLVDEYYVHNQKQLKEYTSSNETAICVLEFLVGCMNQAIGGTQDTTTLQKRLFIGEGTTQRPVLVDFSTFGLTAADSKSKTPKVFTNLRKTVQKLLPAWKVRLLAIEYLFKIVSHQKVAEEIWKKGLDCIACKFEHTENPQICKLIQRSIENLKAQLPGNGHLSARVEYYRGQVKAKLKDRKLGDEVDQAMKDLGTASEALKGQQQIQAEAARLKSMGPGEDAGQKNVDEAYQKFKEKQVQIENLRMLEALSSI